MVVLRVLGISRFLFTIKVKVRGWVEISMAICVYINYIFKFCGTTESAEIY